MQSFTRILFLVIVFLVAYSCFVSFSYSKTLQPATSPNTLNQNVDPNETILKFESFLRSEAKEHRDILESYYAKITGIFAFICVFFGGVLTWLNWKSKEDIRKQVNEQFKHTVETIITDKIALVDILLKESRDKSDQQIKEINKLLLELSKKSETVTPAETTNNVQSLSGKKILWVDDQPANNDYPRQILEEAGITFTTALSTDDALKYISKENFDLIISDMGRGSNYTAGLELLEELKKISIKTPVVIYASSKALRINGEKALALGAIATVTGATAILSKVQKCLLRKI